MKEVRSASAEQLIYVKEDLIMPHSMTFYELIVKKAHTVTRHYTTVASSLHRRYIAVTSPSHHRHITVTSPSHPTVKPTVTRRAASRVRYSPSTCTTTCAWSTTRGAARRQYTAVTRQLHGSYTELTR